MIQAPDPLALARPEVRAGRGHQARWGISNENELVTVAIFLNPFEASIARSSLEAAGITAFLADEGTSVAVTIGWEESSSRFSMRQSDWDSKPPRFKNKRIGDECFSPVPSPNHVRSRCAAACRSTGSEQCRDHRRQSGRNPSDPSNRSGRGMNA